MGGFLRTLAGRSLNTSLTLFLAFILSYLILALLAFAFPPEILRSMLRAATSVEIFLTTTGLPARYNNFIEFYLNKSIILLLFLTIISRILIAIVLSSFVAAMPKKKRTRR